MTEKLPKAAELDNSHEPLLSNTVWVSIINHYSTASLMGNQTFLALKITSEIVNIIKIKKLLYFIKGQNIGGRVMLL